LEETTQQQKKIISASSSKLGNRAQVNQLPQLQQFEAIKSSEGEGGETNALYKHTLKNAQTSVSSALDELMGKILELLYVIT